MTAVCSVCYDMIFGIQAIWPRPVIAGNPDMTDDKLRSSAPSMMLYQKVLTGVGAVFQRLMCRFIGHCLQRWTTRIIHLI